MMPLEWIKDIPPLSAKALENQNAYLSYLGCTMQYLKGCIHHLQLRKGMPGNWDSWIEISFFFAFLKLESYYDRGEIENDVALEILSN